MTRTPRPFGFWTATALVAGNMIGAGIYTLPSALAKFGPLSLVGFVIAALGAMCLASVYAQLTLAHPLSGGPYAHGEMAFGKFTGFMVAWGYWIMNWTGSAATAVGTVGYLSTFIPEINTDRWLAFQFGLAIVWFFTGINCLGLRSGGIVQVVLTALKLIPLVVFPLFAFKGVHVANLTSGPMDWSVINTSALLAMWSFIGLEAATVPTQSIQNPGKTVGRATIVGTAVTACLYLLTIITLYGLVPIQQLAQSNASFVDAASALFDHNMAPLMAICIMISGMGGLNGWILVHGQVPEAMAKDKIFPAIFAKVTKNGAPVAGLIIGTCLMSVVMLVNVNDSLIDQFTMIIEAGGALTLFAYFISSLSAFKLLKNKRKLGPVFWVMCTLATGFSIWAIFGAGWKILGYCGLAYLSGLPVYFWISRRCA